MDELIENWIGGYQFDDILVDELIVNAFSYNVMEPRFYSKHTATVNSTIYNISIADAAQASISTPLYFEPFLLDHPGTNYS